MLRTKSVAVAAVDDALRRLAQEMLVTMYRTKGVGLAAQQVGRTERLCVIDVPVDCEEEADAQYNASIEMPLVMFNPRIVAAEGEVRDREGCLSFPGIGGEVVRAAAVVCQYVDADNVPRTISARGFLARALQHEIDHLDGILYIDHFDESNRTRFSAKLTKLCKANGGCA